MFVVGPQLVNGTHGRYRMSLQSALLGYLISLLMPVPMTPQENVILQTTATATGTVLFLSDIICSCQLLIDHDNTDAFGRGLRRDTASIVSARPRFRWIAPAALVVVKNHSMVVCYSILRVSHEAVHLKRYLTGIIVFSSPLQYENKSYVNLHPILSIRTTYEVLDH